MSSDNYNNLIFLEEEQEEFSQEEEQEELSQEEEQEELSQEEEQEELSQEEEQEELSQVFVSQEAFTSVDYSNHFLILENIGYFQLFFTGTLAIFFVLWLVYKFFRSFF